MSILAIIIREKREGPLANFANIKLLNSIYSYKPASSNKFRDLKTGKIFRLKCFIARYTKF